MDYVYHTTPFAHQDEEFLNTRELIFHALFWEQGTGKTKVIIDTAAYLYEKSEIDGLLVLAPNGVHRNWTDDEIPIHLPERLKRDLYIHCYQSGKSTTKWHQARGLRVLHHQGFSILAMSYDGFQTPRGKKLARAFLGKRRVLQVLDESSEIKSPGAKRTISVVASGRYAKYRRILEGTPVDNGPFCIYSPMKFLSENFWKEHDMDNYAEFKTHFGRFEEHKRKNKNGKLYDFTTVVGYRRLGYLRSLLEPVSSRVLKRDVLDLPPKSYSKQYFDLAPEQSRVYNELRRDSMSILESGELVTTPLALVKLLRLQQVTCGYVPTDDPDTEPEVLIGDRNPRLDMAVEFCDRLPHKALIWARFRKDLDLLEHKLGDRCVRYDGTVNNDDRARNKYEFQNNPRKQFFLGNQAAAGRGLTLTAAQSELYYSNTFSLGQRLQSEDRAHRIGQEHPVGITDMVGYDTIDNKIVESLRTKWDISNEILGDQLGEWI